MADITRTAKSGHEWTRNELEAYNISFDFQDTQTFFGTASLPDPEVHPDLLAFDNPRDTRDRDTRRLLQHLRLAMRPIDLDESSVDDFASHLLEYMGYAELPRLVRTRNELRFFTCGQSRFAKLDVCVFDADDLGVILLVQEDKRFGSGADARGQLVAEAIAAFQDKNNNWVRAGMPTTDSKMMPGIIMVGTAPSFFKIPVTEELDRCVRTGHYPATRTVVQAYVPPVLSGAGWFDGMGTRANQRSILQCFEAFRKYVV